MFVEAAVSGKSLFTPRRLVLVRTREEEVEIFGESMLILETWVT